MQLREFLKEFRQNEDGTSTIEFLLWVPIMVMMLTMTTDATMLMHSQQNLYNAARDSSRQVALGQKTEEEARDILISRFDFDILEVSVLQSNGFVTTSVEAPFSEFSNISGFFLNGSLAAEVSMWVENYDS